MPLAMAVLETASTATLALLGLLDRERSASKAVATDSTLMLIPTRAEIAESAAELVPVRHNVLLALTPV